jgi:hypothetical protein
MIWGKITTSHIVMVFAGRGNRECGMQSDHQTTRLLRLAAGNMPQMQSVKSAATATNNATGTAEAAEDLGKKKILQVTLEEVTPGGRFVVTHVPTG